MQALVRIQMPDGTTTTLRPGAIIGRLQGAALLIDHPAISEAHALLSLRGTSLKLLSLRGVLSVDGIASSEVTLFEGMQITFAHGVVIKVVDIQVPNELFAVCGVTNIPIPLTEGAYSITPQTFQLVPHFIPDALAYIWSTEQGWRARTNHGPTIPFEPDVQVSVEGRDIWCVMVPLVDATRAATRETGRLHAPVEIIANYDTVHIHRSGHFPCTLSGNSARIISELVAMNGPVSWEAVARELWRQTMEVDILRIRWDRNLAKLRTKLKKNGIRGDLVRSDGTGNVELVLQPGDKTVDQS